MDELKEQGKGKGLTMRKSWEEMRKGGSAAPTPEAIESILRGDNSMTLSREKVIEKISGYLLSKITVKEDPETGERSAVWSGVPTKAGLALALGISPATLCRYVAGAWGGNRYNPESPNSHPIINPADFDLLRKAYTMVEEFYEGRLGSNGQPVGAIFWLKNKASIDGTWKDKSEVETYTRTDWNNGEIPDRAGIISRLPGKTPHDEEMEIDNIIENI